MNATTMARQFRSIRYYICEGDRPILRIPNNAHHGLIAGTLAWPQFESQKLKVLEVFVGGTNPSPTMLNVKGSVYSLDADGYLDTQQAVEAIVHVIEGPKPRRVQPNVIDIGPTVRHRQWTVDNIWQPTQPLLRAVAEDLRRSSSGAKIKTLKV